MTTSWEAKPLSDNERLILGLVRRREPIARSAVTLETHLTQPWVHRLVEQLLVRQLIASGPPLKGARGQPSVTLSLIKDAAFALGVAVDTDGIRVCIADLSCRVLEDVKVPTTPRTRRAAVEATADVLQQMLARHEVVRERVVGVGVSIPGFFVNDGTQVNAPEPLRDWSLVELRPELEAAFGFPVTIENNATAAAIGENMTGVGRWARTFCYLDFGYGFGSGLVIDGQPYLGRRGNAGEISVAAPNVEASRRPALRYLLEELGSQGVRIDSVEQLNQRFDPNWPGLDRWIAHIQPTLDQVVNTVGCLLDPDAIVFGGMLPTALGLQLIGSTRFWDVEHRYGVAPPRPRLVLAEGGNSVPALGAALSVLSSHFF